MVKKQWTYNAFLFFMLLPLFLHAQDEEAAVKAINKFQEELNKEYKDAEKSPLDPKDRRRFKRHEFFPIDLKYKVTARLEKGVDETTFKMKTSTTRLADYKKFAVAVFQLDGKEYRLPIYQSLDLMKKGEYKDYLFLPFTDLTNGDETYGGGRYLDLSIPAGDDLIIDFNQAYNPYCAYSKRYSCPTVPEENNIEMKIEAGLKSVGKH
jgi:uncharacterized protein